MERNWRDRNNDRGRGRGDRRGYGRRGGRVQWHGNGGPPIAFHGDDGDNHNRRPNQMHGQERGAGMDDIHRQRRDGDQRENVAGGNHPDENQRHEEQRERGNIAGENHRQNPARQHHGQRRQGEEPGNAVDINHRGHYRPPHHGERPVPFRGGNHEGIPRQRHGDLRGERNVPNEIPAGPDPRTPADQKTQHTRRIKHHDLVEMTKLDAEVLLTRMNNRKSGFCDALNDDVLLQRLDSMSAILTCINTTLQCESVNRSAKHQLLNHIRPSTFLSRHINSYFSKMMTEPSNPKLRSYKEPIKNSLAMFRQLLQQFPSSFHEVRIAFGILVMVANDLRTRSSVIDADTDESLDQTQQMLNALTEQQRALAQERDIAQDSPAGAASLHRRRRPPNNFREMSIFPDIQLDIHNKKDPFLRENIIRGSFDSVEDYLDIQFRLLREDFIRPLREGIREYLDRDVVDAGLAAGRRPKKLSNIRVYHNVSVLNPVCMPGGVHYRIKFDVSQLRYVKWQYSKRLIFGSLVCLSSDDFTTIRIATVANRSPDKIKDGELEINFENREDDADGNSVQDIKPDEHFVMVETAGYFEAYRHVLTALQQTQDDDIPFRENIVKCEKEVLPPQYLLTADEPSFDLRAIAGRKRLTVDSDDSDDDTDVDMLGQTDLASVNILQPESWPAAATLHLDETQLKALRTALTRRVAIIQGPPGTGKTYIGLKIVQTLLDNSDMWNRVDPEENSPILVVCYTNHALDQFLEGVSRFVRRGIVRVGGRSKSKKMEEFLLKEQRKKLRDSREVPRRIFLERKNAQLELEMSKVEIEQRSALIEGADRGLIHESILQEFMREDHYDNLISYFFPDNQMNQPWLMKGIKSNYGPSVLPMWLELVDVIQADERDMLQEPGWNEGESVAQDELEEASDDEALAEEEERRLVDNDDEEENERRLQEQNRQRRNVQRADERLALNFIDVYNGDMHETAGDGIWQEPRGNRKKRLERLRRRLQSTVIMTSDEVDQVNDLWELTIEDRWKLYRFWINDYVKDIRHNMADAEKAFQIAANNLKELLEAEDMSVMRKMKVIGMTTTGAAKYINTLRQIQPKIIVVEEAAEVLEAHVIAPLSRACEHLILIGDHQQLRPSPQVYHLAENYNLKYSLFERLVCNDLDHETLSKQHRMRPEIAGIMEVFYKELTNDESVNNYDNVKGVAKNMYFINHDEEEQMDDELRSVSNEHEAQFVIALGNYFVQQGYSPSKITILTPYVGQVFALRQLLRERQPMMNGVQICPIDNFQGEENEIILLSLVRSNRSKKIGFLKEDNRVCVALSRAKQGFYVIGNFSQLVRESTTWSKVIAKAKEQQAYGRSLRLCCQNHPKEAQIEVHSKADFNKAPEGGCLRECGYRLACGHACDRVCHPYDQNHAQYICQKPCQKNCKDGHKCLRQCSQSCGPCQQMVSKKLVKCGHTQPVKCSMAVDEVVCSAPCCRTLSCGHKCENRCGDACTTQCNKTIFRQCLKGHRFMLKCFQHTEVMLCKESCCVLLQCEHQCTGNCGECFSGRLHVSCSAACNRTLVCGHSCNVSCTKNCPPCQQPCENRCNHSRCPRDCGRPCEPCRERCLWQCSHHQCTKLCHEPCNRPRCNEPCTKQLVCGHPCIGMCGEKCPSKCRLCHKDEVTLLLFGNEDEPDARFVQLEDCNHIFEVTGLDKYMDDQANDTSVSTAIQLKTCPRCRVAIRRNLRYGTSINKVLNDIELVKEKMIGNLQGNRTKVVDLMRRLDTLKLKEDFSTFYKERLNILGLSDGELVSIENILHFLEYIIRLQSKIHDKSREGDVHIVTKRSFSKLNTEAQRLKEWLMKKRVRFSDQEMFDSKMEITRIDLCFRCIQIEAKLRSAEHPRLTADKKETFRNVLKMLTDHIMSNELEKEAEEMIRSTQKLMSGIGVSAAERLEIISAMGLTKGHWFKCPNGHVYAIGDCGGATVEGKCPECDATIGGTSHALRADNSFAPEFDYASASAWPGMDARR